MFLGLYKFSYRTVGMKIDGNCCPYLLSPTGSWQSVARFAKPFESRPADTGDESCSRTQPGQSGWIAPTPTYTFCFSVWAVN